MASYHWSIATDEFGSDSWTFTVNPLDISGVFPSRAYSAISVLKGAPLLQFPASDTRLRTIRFDFIPDEHVAHRQFAVGESEDDTDSLLYLKKLNDDGKLTTYWLTIPTPYKHYRPYGYRENAAIPIRVEDVRTVPQAGPGYPRWKVELDFRIVPVADADQTFKVDYSPLDSVHYLVSSHLGSVYTYDQTGPTYTDRTTEAYTGGTPFPSFTVVAGDMVYCGCSTKFYGVRCEMDTSETVEPDEEQGATKNALQFWNGSSWGAVTIQDETVGLTKTDRFTTWGPLSNWTTADLSAIVAGAPVTDALYWVRLVAGTVTTAWSLDKLLRA